MCSWICWSPCLAGTPGPRTCISELPWAARLSQVSPQLESANAPTTRRANARHDERHMLGEVGEDCPQDCANLGCRCT